MGRRRAGRESGDPRDPSPAPERERECRERHEFTAVLFFRTADRCALALARHVTNSDPIQYNCTTRTGSRTAIQNVIGWVTRNPGLQP